MCLFGLQNAAKVTILCREMTGEQLREWSDTQAAAEKGLLDKVSKKTRQVVNELLPLIRAEALAKIANEKTPNPERALAEVVLKVDITFTDKPRVNVSAAPMPPVIRV